MGQVQVTLNGRTYRLACGDGEEGRLHALAAHVRSKVDTLARELGQVGEERLFLMAALLVADELFEARERVQTAAATGAVPATDAPAPAATPAAPLTLKKSGSSA
jgi:cell division protein ZapA